MHPKYKHLPKFILNDFAQIQTKKLKWGKYKDVSVGWLISFYPTYVKWLIDEGLLVGDEKVVRWLYEKAWKKCPQEVKDRFCKYPELQLEEVKW